MDATQAHQGTNRRKSGSLRENTPAGEGCLGLGDRPNVVIQREDVPMFELGITSFGPDVLMQPDMALWSDMELDPSLPYGNTDDGEAQTGCSTSLEWMQELISTREPSWGWTNVDQKQAQSSSYPWDYLSHRAQTSIATVEVPSALETVQTWRDNPLLHSSNKVLLPADGTWQPFCDVEPPEALDHIIAAAQPAPVNLTHASSTTVPKNLAPDPILPPRIPKIASSDVIVSIFRTSEPNGYVFMCRVPECGGKTFGRWPDFTRHDKTFHKRGKTMLWCPVLGCEYSNAGRNKGFPEVRKDKLMEHMRNKHSLEYTGTSD